MGHIDHRITHKIRNRIQEILVADGLGDHIALDEANSICDGLGYMNRVRASTGLQFSNAYDGVEVHGNAGDLIETIPFERLEEFF